VVQLSRRSPLHKFVVHAIQNATPRSNNSSKREISASSTGSIEDHRAVRLSGPKPRGWLINPFKKSTPVILLDAGSRTAVELNEESQISSRVVHDAAEYNWASFFCPYCNASSFIRCSGGHFACDGTVEMRSGRRFHRCFCGNAGFIEGAIKTFEANQSSLSVSPEATAASPVESSKAKGDEPATTALPSSAKRNPLSRSKNPR
jgi:hypothetical protein